MDIATERILKCAKGKKVSDAEICRVLGAKKDKVYTWKTERSTPTTEEVKVLAEYFDVTTDFLLGNSDAKRPAIDDNEEDILDSVSFALYGKTGELTEEELEDIRSYARFKKEQRKKKEK